MIFFKLLFAIIVRTLTDISFKAAVHRVEFSSFNKSISHTKDLAKNPYIWAGCIAGVVNMFAWTSILKDMDLSYAYPFFRIIYITIILSGKVFFHETLDKHKIAGIICISLGAAALFLG